MADDELEHPDPATNEDAHAGGDVADAAHGLPGGEVDPEGPAPSEHTEAVVEASHDDSTPADVPDADEEPWIDEHGHVHDVDDHGHGHDHHDVHGHDDHHGDHGPADDTWVLAPIVAGIVIGIILVVVFGLATGAAPFV